MIASIPTDLIQKLQQRLQAPLPGNDAHALMFPAIKSMPEQLPDNMKLSAVMALLFMKDQEWHILAIRRTADGHAHSGQISFPGGKEEETDENLQATALRETFEEVGIPAASIEVIGALSPLFIVVSNFRVFPFVGMLPEPMTDYTVSQQEVAHVLEIPLSVLFAPESKVQTVVSSPAYPEIKRTVNAYQLPDGTIIWGATAMMLSEFEVLWKEIAEEKA